MPGKIIIDDRELFRPAYSTVCTFCLHFRPDDQSGRYRCDAFGADIPDPIWYGEHDHKTPYEGDKGIQFESRTKTGEGA